MSSILVELTADEFQTEILDYEGSALVEFYAEWCGPCKMIVPILESLYSSYNNRIKFCKMDIEKGGSLSKQLGISSVPALLFFTHGQVVLSKFGLRRKQDIEQDILGVIGNEKER
jgi:thioredoxin 1